jgi:hypothetical protein
MIKVANRVELFKKKIHELAWTLLNSMNKIHHCHTLHNNTSFNNVILHFLPNFPDKVYIGICNWAMVGYFNDLKEYLYIYKSEEIKFKIMQHRWWVALELI